MDQWVLTLLALACFVRMIVASVVYAYNAVGNTQSCAGRQSGSSSTVISKDNAVERTGDENKEKNERINKYKEQRRRQLASKYADWSSSEDITSVGEEPSYVRFSSKYRRLPKSNATKIPHLHDPGGSGEPSSTMVTSPTGIVRSNRASRLRALAVGGQDNVVGNEFVRSASFRAKLNSDEDNFQRGVVTRRSFNGSISSPSECNGKNNTGSSHTYISSSDAAPTHDSPQKSRDKSSKRKSNLNRSLIVNVNQDLSRDDSEQRWRKANKLDNFPEVALSEGATSHYPLRADVDLKSREKQFSMKRPEIPQILLQGRANREERSVSTTNPVATSDRVVTNRDSSCASQDDESIDNNAVNAVNQLAQLVEKTTAKVDTLTNAAAGSSEATTALTLQSRVVKTSDGSSIVSISSKPPPFSPPHEQHVSRIGLRDKWEIDKEATTTSQSENDTSVPVRFELNRRRSSEDDTNKIIHPLPILKKSNVGEVNGPRTTVENESVLPECSTNGIEEGTKSHSILKWTSGGSSETEEMPHHGILKRRSSVDGGEPKPILKKRSSIEELGGDQLKPILKTHRGEDADGNSSSASSKFSCEDSTIDGNELRPILKRQHRYDEPPPSILKASSVGEKKRASILKSQFSSENLNYYSETKEEENKNSDSDGEIALLPSILKKKCKEVHPLATPFTEFQSILKSKQPPQIQTPKPPVEIMEGFNDQRRMSVAERIMQMENKLADEAERTPTPPSVTVKESNLESRYAVIETSRVARLDGISSSRRVRERYSARYHTQPITFDEVINTASVNDSKESDEKETNEGESPVKTQFRATVCLQRSRTQPITSLENRSVERDCRSDVKSEDSDEDPSKMSLAERVHFFDRKVMEEKFALNKTPDVQQHHSRNRNLARFKTQPITIAEVEKAQRQEMGEKATEMQNDDEQRRDKIDRPIDMNGSPECHSPPKVHPPPPRGRATIIMSSSNDEDSSGPGFREGRRVIKNEAINRRRNAALRRKDERRSMCDLYSGVGTEPLLTNNLHQRSNTAPITKFELDKLEEPSREVVSIADRLAALRKSGDEKWRERIQTKDEHLFKKQSTTPTITIVAGSTDDVSGTCKSLAGVREKRRPRDDRPSSIVDIISQLGVAQQEWKQRVEEKDSSQFTVAGRMGCVDSDAQIVDRIRLVPKANVFTPDSQMIPLQRSVSEPVCNVPIVVSASNDKNLMRVAVPKIDDESFHAFFESVQSKDSHTTHVEISDDGFQQMTTTCRQMLVQKKNITKQRRTAVASRNPVKMLASRSDLQNEYEENKTHVKEIKRLKAQQIAQSPSLAMSALAGLASNEDFSAITLKKGSPLVTGSLLPFKDLMLIQVKGRRHVQTRLVKPKVSSMNSGDNYILVTPNQVFNWIGRFSNVIERSKGSEVASVIQSKRELGYSSSFPVIVIDEERAHTSVGRDDYLKLLDGDAEEIGEAENPKEDEMYENAIIDTNMVYEVEADRLIPHPQCWGTLPKIDLLESNKVLVFDFGSEMYVWQGKLSPMSLRKIAIHLAQELWNQGYNYSDCAINPLCPSLTGENEGLSKQQVQRPSWSLFAKINQHMETILFREKFVDWPESQRIIRIKNLEKNKTAVSSPLVPCDSRDMLAFNAGEPDLILEGSHVGRGKSYWDADSRRHYEITTLGIKVWHVVEKGYKLLPRESWSQFYSGDTNVVRWQYMITVTGRDLSGQMSRHSFVGRERCAYFFWQGAESTVNDKGASALMTVELNEERGPHIRVDEGHEPPCFLALFDGAMIIHKGKRKLVVVDQDEDADVNYVHPRLRFVAEHRLYIVRSPVESESCLIEVEPSRSSLRSRGSLIFIDVCDGLICVWHGAKSPAHLQQVASAAANIVKERRPLEVGFECNLPLRLNEVSEGDDDESLLTLLESTVDERHHSYDSLIRSSRPFDFTPRLFHMTSVSGCFSAVEISCSFRSSRFSCPFPFLQADVYGTDQPALFVLDNDYEVYLWQGWWPEPSDDNDNVATGSAKVRWNADRRCAMETVLSYCREKNASSPPPAYLVSAGLEPHSFTNLFPSWDKRDDIAILNAQDGKKQDEYTLVEDVLPHLLRSRFTLQELRDRPLPEGVDPSRIESYLDENDFEELLEMTPAEFYILPAWKQCKLKQALELF